MTTTNPGEAAEVLDVIVGDQKESIHLSREMIEQAQPLFQRMNDDMDGGWRLGREFLDAPTTLQRCQVAADRLLTAMHVQNEAVQSLMAAYILHHCPGVRSVDINGEGEMLDTLFYDAQDALIRDGVRGEG